MNILQQATQWAEGVGAKIKAWATQGLEEGEKVVEEIGQAADTEAHQLVNQGVTLLTQLEPKLLNGLTTAWKNVVSRAESGGLDAAGFEQAVIQEAEVLGEDVLAGVTSVGSPGLQALFALLKVVFPAI
jgi:hypothetical protein